MQPKISHFIDKKSKAQPPTRHDWAKVRYLFVAELFCNHKITAIAGVCVMCQHALNTWHSWFHFIFKNNSMRWASVAPFSARTIETEKLKQLAWDCTTQSTAGHQRLCSSPVRLRLQGHPHVLSNSCYRPWSWAVITTSQPRMPYPYGTSPCETWITWGVVEKAVHNLSSLMFCFLK